MGDVQCYNKQNQVGQLGTNADEASSLFSHIAPTTWFGASLSTGEVSKMLQQKTANVRKGENSNLARDMPGL